MILTHVLPVYRKERAMRIFLGFFSRKKEINPIVMTKDEAEEIRLALGMLHCLIQPDADEQPQTQSILAYARKKMAAFRCLEHELEEIIKIERIGQWPTKKPTHMMNG